MSEEEMLTTTTKFINEFTKYKIPFRMFEIENGMLIDFVHRGWDYSVEITNRGSLEFYGVQINGTGQIEPVEFATLNDSFYDLINYLLK